MSKPTEYKPYEGKVGHASFLGLQTWIEDDVPYPFPEFYFVAKPTPIHMMISHRLPSEDDTPTEPLMRKLKFKKTSEREGYVCVQYTWGGRTETHVYPTAVYKLVSEE